MASSLKLFKVTNEDGTKNVTKIVLLGTTFAAGVAGISLLSYKLVNYFSKKRDQDDTAAKGVTESGKDGMADGAINVNDRSDPLFAAMQLKEEGNKKYKARKYAEAKECYTRAIKTCPPTESKNLAIFYQNRAAASDAMNLWSEVISDCDAAIARDARYQKAYSRRGKAKLVLHQYEEALQDAACGFYLQDKPSRQNQELFEEAITKKSIEQMTRMIESRELVPVGEECVKTITENFPSDPVLIQLKHLATAAEGQTRTPFQEACHSLMNNKFNDIVPHLDEELQLSNKLDNGEERANLRFALLLRATFLTLGGCPSHAEKDLDTLLKMNDLDPRLESTARMRRGLIYVAKMETREGLDEMSKAEKIDPTNPDVYHHRGQIALLMQDYDQCQRDTQKALELTKLSNVSNPKITFQQYMCELQLAQVRRDFSDYEEIIRKMDKGCEDFPEDSECWCLYAQALLFYGNVSAAEAVYERALKHCTNNPRLYVQRAAMLLSWKKDVDGAFKCLHKAADLDPTCEAVYENLGILHLHRKEIEEALAAFSKQLKYTRTAMDIRNCLTMIEAVKAQVMMKERFSMDVENLFNVGVPT